MLCGSFLLPTALQSRKKAVFFIFVMWTILRLLDALQDAEHGVVKSTDEIAAVGHRVLHAGTKYCVIWWEIRRRLMLRNRKYLQKGETDKVHHIKLQFFSNITSDDEKFLQDAIDCVNRHLDDPEFDVTQFVNEMATSRTTLHKKMKSLTGLNTTSFVRSIRLKAACKIMDENKNIRISDLAYKVGFNDPKYFSICFKKEFGMQPTEYSMKSAKNT